MGQIEVRSRMDKPLIHQESQMCIRDSLNGKYASDPTELEKKVREFLAATGGVAEGQEPENSVPTGAGTLKMCIRDR